MLGSSESSYGICFANQFFEPKYLPVDEAHPQLPEDTCGLTKVVNEATAAMFHRRDGTQILSYLPGVTELESELNGRTSLISNRRAKELLGWTQQFFLQ